jgi:hypothetical protein
VGLPPSALARWAQGVERRRVLARALHVGPAPRTPQIAERLEGLRTQIAHFRARAIELHAKLIELETKGDPEAPALRASMMASVVRIENVVRSLVETPDPATHRRPALAARPRR